MLRRVPLQQVSKQSGAGHDQLHESHAGSATYGKNCCSDPKEFWGEFLNHQYQNVRSILYYIPDTRFESTLNDTRMVSALEVQEISEIMKAEHKYAG
jgi:hypothetical protein